MSTTYFRAIASSPRYDTYAVLIRGYDAQDKPTPFEISLPCSNLDHAFAVAKAYNAGGIK